MAQGQLVTPPTTSRGNIVYFYISRPRYFGRLVLFFLSYFEKHLPQNPAGLQKQFV